MEFKGKQFLHCSFCDFKCALKSSLENHIRVHTRERPFICDQCQRSFFNTTCLKVHIKGVHQGLKVQEKKRNYKCSLCPYATHNREYLEVHKQAHTEERTFPCQHQGCRFVGITPPALVKHKRYKHKNRGPFLCPFPNCTYRGKTKNYLRGHVVAHSESRPFACDFEGCSYQAKRPAALRVHKVGVHHSGRKPFSCSSCNYCATSKFLLKRHQRHVHLERKPVKCDSSGCGISCTTKANLAQHILRHHKERKFKCDFDGCLSTAASLCKLGEHKKRVHYGKVHKCPICDYRAAYPSKLKEHIVCHNANVRKLCPENGCKFQTKRSDLMKKHLRRHKANLGCPVEGCSYFGKSKRHMKTHDPTGRPFLCPFCSKYFDTNSHRSRHLLSHTKEKPFRCPACSFEAIERGTVTKHIREMHQIASDKESICDHCNVDFGSAIGLAMHSMKLKTAVVLLTRL